MANINKLFNEKNNAIKFVDDYSSITFEAKRKAAEEPEPEPSKAKLKCKNISIRNAWIIYKQN